MPSLVPPSSAHCPAPGLRHLELGRAQGSLVLTGAQVSALPNQGTAKRLLHVLSLVKCHHSGVFTKETPPEAGPEPQIVTLANLEIRLKSYSRQGGKGLNAS